jgi:hypothetical protein
MENNKLEERLEQMSKPRLPELKHSELLFTQIISNRERTVVSGWFLSIPLFIVAVLIMKARYFQGEGYLVYLQQFIIQQKLLSVLFFVAIPILILVFMVTGIRKVRYLAGKPRFADFLRLIWIQLLIGFVCLLIICMYII